MPSSSVALCRLALAALGLGALIGSAAAQNVAAFNPYNGVGMLGGAAPPAAATVAPGARAYPPIEAPPTAAVKVEPAPTPTPIAQQRAPAAAAPAPQPAPPAASPPPAPAAAVTPPERPIPPAASVAPAVTVTFTPQSAEISDAGRKALDAMAEQAAGRGVKQIELRAYAGAADAADARKVALARALSVRSYLIDLGVKARIEVGAFAAAQRGGASERVDVVLP